MKSRFAIIIFFLFYIFFLLFSIISIIFNNIQKDHTNIYIFNSLCAIEFRFHNIIPLCYICIIFYYIIVFHFSKEIGNFHWMINLFVTGRRSVHRYLPEDQQRSKIRPHRYLLAGCRRNCTRFLRNYDSSRIVWRRRMKATRSLATGNSPLWWWTGLVYILLILDNSRILSSC